MSSGYGSGSGGKPKKSAAERSPVKVGELIADKYRVVEILAAGGMGVVVAAEHVQLGQRYAVKFLLSDAQHAQSVERFLREARAAACIESTRVCRVFDCGTLPDGSPYMVMEHLVGHDLGHELKTRGRLPVGETVDLLLQALEGIAEAHAVGIVHRDLKPSNLFLCQKPGRAREVKVLDFGISKLMATDESTEEDLTATATMLGSPRYMSPEQVQNAKNVDARTDIWSLGVILYQLLDGRSPFAGTTMGETIGKVLLHVPPPIRETRSDVPDGIGQVIDRCLERDRERRYRNVAELALALAPFGTPASQPSVQRITALLVGGQLGVPAAALAPTPASPLPRPPPPAEELTRPMQRRVATDDLTVGTVGPVTQAAAAEFRPKRRGLLVAVGALALLGAGAVLALALAGSNPSSPAPVSALAATPPVPAPPPSAAPAVEPSPSATAVATAPSAEPVASAPVAPSASASPALQPVKKPVKPGRPGKRAEDLLSDSY